MARGIGFPAISDNTALRFFFVFMVYVAQGVPVGLFFFAIPNWLAANGASAGEVGAFVSVTSLPWTLKFVNGFIMDRFAFLAMGRRRAWLIGAQTIMLAGLIAGASARLDATDIAMLSAFSFMIMAATTFQDVAVDGLAVDLVPDAERARANGMMFGGQAVGIAGGTALSGAALASFGVPAAFLGVGVFVLAILAMIAVLRERPGERLLPWLSGEASPAAAAMQVSAWLPLFRNVLFAMTRRDSLVLCLSLLSAGLAGGLYYGAAPVIATGFGGWSDAEFSSVTGLANLLSGFAGIVVFGVLVDRFGTRAASIAAFFMYGAIGVAMALNPDLWGQRSVVTAFAIGSLVLGTLLQISNCAAAMRFCSPKVAATQFTIYMAISNLGVTISSSMLGRISAFGGETAMLLALAGACGIGIGACLLMAPARAAQVTLQPRVD